MALAELMGGGGMDAVETYRRLDAARHLTKLQVAALQSGAACDEERFFSEIAARSGADKASPSEGEMQQFRERVQTWFRLDDEAQALQRSLKTKRVARDEVRDLVVEFMKRFDVEELNTQDGNLRHEVTRRRRAVSKATIEQRLAEHFAGDAGRLEELKSCLFAAPNEDGEDKHKLRRV